ncbi:hypothetical protein LSAT2_029358 [Lamellibrachia satsuma]|nr:hypothetical protein LSAT2_029358 [Lamellibrachia satsuma]
MLGHWTRKPVDYLRYSLKEVARFVLLDRYETALFGEGFLVYIKAPYIKHSSISPFTETETAQYANSQSRNDSLNSLTQHVFSYLCKMHTSILCAFAVCLVLSLLDKSEAACFTVQRRKCNSSGCWTVSVTVCNRKKRSVESQLEDAAAPQPADLSHYDEDMDGRISPKEFEMGLGDDVTFEEALQAHIQADVNGDGFLSCHEFLIASFPFELIAERSCL